MEFDEIKTKFDQEIEKFLKRIKINQIIGMAPINSNGKSWTEKKCDTHLKISSFNKVPVINAFFLNDHNNPNITLHRDEYNALLESLRQCAQFLTDEIVEYCKYGENQYELNELIKNSILLIDANIYQMNYESWEKEVFKSKPDDTFFVLFGNKKVCKHIVYMDLKSHCWQLVEYEFGYRELLLYRLKNYLIDIYSAYLLLPAIGVNPKIKYTCSPTDICELIIAIDNPNEIKDSAKLTAIMLDMFGISQQVYNNASHSIRNRHKCKSVFVQKLSDKLNNLPASKKTNSDKEVLPTEKTQSKN